MKPSFPVFGALAALILLAQSRCSAADPVVVNLTVNTEADEDDPHVSSDGRWLYYASDARGSWDLYFSTRRALTQPWAKGQLYDDYLQSNKDDERGVSLTPEGRYPQFMFASVRKTQNVSQPNFDIFVCVKQGARAGFTAPTAVNAVATEADEMHPWLTGDGKRLYFTRKDKDGLRVYHSSRQTATGAAGFMPPVAIKEFAPGFHHATLTPDGRTMYLQGPSEKGRWGLFVSTWSGSRWTDPLPLMINSPDAPNGDGSPCLSRDGRLLYFASDRPGGKGKKDLWVVRTDGLKTVSPERER